MTQLHRSCFSLSVEPSEGLYMLSVFDGSKRRSKSKGCSCRLGNIGTGSNENEGHHTCYRPNITIQKTVTDFKQVFHIADVAVRRLCQGRGKGLELGRFTGIRADVLRISDRVIHGTERIGCRRISRVFFSAISAVGRVKGL